ncbi:MAG: 2-hydroxyacyl-CoA dehydratase [Coriobacteriia bacterium]|nr:2-hydroxyacyl-CoA dehydratase [Coriobacteriia bacterium]
MRKTYTILAPNMLPIHWKLVEKLFALNNYHVEILDNHGPEVVQTGLKYVHNDTCYPALLVIGQLISALESGTYDLSKTALMITQTGGGCRASNYIHLLRKALKKAGFEHIPVISLNLSGFEKNSGFKLTLPMTRQLLCGLAYGDLLTLLNNQIKPYQVRTHESQDLVGAWIERLIEQFKTGKGLKVVDIKKNFKSIVEDFARIKTEKTRKKKVGVVGEIYIKYASLGNNELEKFLAEQECEVMVPGIMSFMLFKTDNRLEDIKLYGGSSLKRITVQAFLNYLTRIESALLDALKPYPHFIVPAPYQELKRLVEPFVGHGNKMGEGWLLTAEMVELIEHGYENIVCAQPFGCLPNHIVGKGMIRKIRESYPQANIVPIDYDPGATRVNQENRIKLMLALAKPPQS